MVKLIYGQDEYRAKKKLDELIAGFLVSDPERMNLEQIDGAGISYSDFDRAISTMPFLADRRMVIISNLLTKNKDSELKSKIADRILKIPESVDLIFFESGDPDKRTALFKRLSKSAEYFAPLVGAELDRFISENVKSAGLTMEYQAVRLLAFGIGPDLNRLGNEISKLILFSKSRGNEKISEQDVLDLVELTDNSNVFQFIESLSTKNSKKASEHLYNLIKSGENEIKVLSMVVYQYRNLIILKDYLEAGEKPTGLASKAKMHPFVVQKTLPVLKNYSAKDLSRIYSFLQNIDMQIKVGEIEPTLALNMVVAKLTN